MADGQPERRVVDILTGAWQAQALYAVAALGLPDHVAAGDTTAEKIAAAAGCGRDGIERLMRLTAAIGLFETTADGGYRLTAAGELLRSDGERSMRDMALIYGDEFHRAWGQVVPALREGTPGFAQAFSVSLHDYLRSEPGAGGRFQRAMNAGNVFFGDVPRAFDFTSCRTVVDVAGGSGMLLAAVLRAHPGLHGVLFDLPHVMPVAQEHLHRVLGPDRWRTIAGDAFKEVPPGADAYLLSRVLQDWDDPRCVRLLGAVREAMPATGRLLILERVIPTDGSGLLPLLWDLHLLMVAGGRERTLDGYRSVLDGAGLRLESVTPLSLETSLLVAALA